MWPGQCGTGQAASVRGVLAYEVPGSREWGGCLASGVRLTAPATAAAQSNQSVIAGVEAVSARQKAWLSASLQERVKLAEAIGEEGARALARLKDYETHFDGVGRVLSQGPDQVYRAKDGSIVVIERRGARVPLDWRLRLPAGHA